MDYINADIISNITSDIAKRYRVVPYKVTEKEIYFYSSSDIHMSRVKDDLEILTGKNIIIDLVDNEVLTAALIRYYFEDSVEDTFEFSTSRSITDLIKEAKDLRASDIHIEAYEELFRIRFRIDGKLVERHILKEIEFRELNNRIKIEAGIDITEKRKPQDGRIREKDLDLRVSVLPTLHGEKIVLRVLGTDASSLNLEDLGMDAEELGKFFNAIRKPNGIILISGPTGSGKTTTLYACLNHLNKVHSNIVTIEDPIEYTLKGINQVQLKEDIGLTFESALKSFLRQDPDIIMVGEIRDSNTANMAMRAALTGHLVLSTIHTNSAMGIISRLLDMAIPEFLIRETINLAVAQRLIRKLCDFCKVQETIVDDDVLKSFLDIDQVFYNKKGCKNCNFTGFKGRLAIYDILELDSFTSSSINTSKKPITDDGLFQKGLKYFLKGQTTFSEIQPLLKSQL